MSLFNTLFNITNTTMYSIEHAVDRHAATVKRIKTAEEYYISTDGFISLTYRPT